MKNFCVYGRVETDGQYRLLINDIDNKTTYDLPMPKKAATKRVILNAIEKAL